MSDTEEIGDGAKLLLARIETHPEDFVGVYGANVQHRLHSNRWEAVIYRYWHALNTAEQAAITAALTEANRRNFHTDVMREILAPEQMSLPGLEPVAYQTEKLSGFSNATTTILGAQP